MTDAAPRGGTSGLNLLGIFGVAFVVLAILFYIQQDLSGAKQLATAEARWKAAGFSLAAADYYPAPVPNDQNLAALPLFALEPDPTDPGRLWGKPLLDATDEDRHGGSLFDYEHKQDLPKLVALAYAKQFPGKTPPASLRAQLEELYPLIAELRSTAPARPIFRLNQDYAHKPEWERSYSLVAGELKVAKLFSYDAQLALRETQPQVAVDDYNVAFEVARGVGTDPSLVGGLVTLGVCAITRATIDDGLSRHAWNDQQLAAIQAELKRVDCLTLYQFDMRSEVAAHSLPMYQWCKDQPSAMSLIMSLGSGMTKPRDSFGAWLLWNLYAGGWWDMNAAQTADSILDAAQGADLKSRRVDPKRSAALEARIEEAKAHPAPWNFLYAVATGPMNAALKKFAQGQVQLDEDRIACALERYRLAHGAYPPNLASLAPASIDELPHDILSGVPYHYRLNPDGTFLLYSVGWNQTDDGGKVALLSGSNPPRIDFDNGDWVWPMVKR